MKGVAEYVDTVTVDDDRYDVWESRDDGSILVSEFCESELREPDEQQLDVVLSKIDA